MKKGIRIFILISVTAVFLVIIYLFNKPCRNIETETPSYSMAAETLFNIYSIDEDMSNERYSNRVIQVSGKIAEILKENQQISIILFDTRNSVDCVLDGITIKANQSFVNKLKVGDKITIKGKCDGFDMIMGVVLTRCFIIH